ncbi:MAG TPA: fused MFS/spermidine synthase [Casimicrobiaceae bacterium]|nr:fused MFS/spermidine synthase [Casimicrobiaceae bacterium]
MTLILKATNAIGSFTRITWIELVFFGSGFSALAYQVCWQRVLFASFGIDIESVTIIVSTFMLGLGVGAICGGWVADRYPQRLLGLFACCEAAIGLFGLVSVGLIRQVADWFILAPLPIIASVNFMLLALPTSMMGATLPMLVAHAVRRNGNVGASIGGLYFANTLGAATGCMVVGFFWFHYFELPAAVRAAAAINLLVASIAALVALRTR